MASFQFYFGNKSSDLLDRHESGTHWFPHFDKEDYTTVSVHLNQSEPFAVRHHERKDGRPFIVIAAEERVNTGAYREFQIFADHDSLESLKALQVAINEAIAKLEPEKGGE
jgi:hypothetical protein